MARLGGAVTAVIFGLIIMRTMPAMAARSEFLRKTLESSDSDGSVLVVLPINLLGLANRLRTLASVYSMMCRLREASEGRPFRLLTVWKSTDECPADYSDLFLPHRDENVVVESYDSLWRTDDHERSFEQTVREHVSSVLAEIPSSRGGVYSKQIYPQRGLLEEDFFYPVGDAATNISATRPIVLTVWTRGTHSLRSMHCKGFLFSKSLFYQGLVPVPVVASIIQKTLYGPSFSRGRQVVGIHTRAFDSEYDWAVVGPNGLGDELSLRFDEASPLDAFVFIMGEILKYEPSTLFFVASNSAVAKMELFHRFPHNSVTVHRSGLVDDREYRSTLSGMQFALAEFYLLGETGVIIHSRGSSFAREAAARLQRPVVDVLLRNRDKDLSSKTTNINPYIYFYSTNTNLPDCAMPEYIRDKSSTDTWHDGRVVDTICYIEGGNRTMCSKAYEVCRRKSPIEPSLGNWEDALLHRYDPGSLVNMEQCLLVIAESNGYSLQASV